MMVDNSFVPRAFDARQAKREREELARRTQQQQSARNTAKTTVSSGGRLDVDGGDFSVFNGGRAVVRDGGGFRVEGGGSMEIVDDGEVKAIGDGSDWATGLPIEIAASLSNRETTDSETGNTSLRPGLYFDFADGALSGNPLTGRVWSYSGADVRVDSARKPSRRYTGGSVVNSCGVRTSPTQMLIQAHAFDPTTDGFGGTNPDGIPLPGSTKGITEVRVEPHEINIIVSDFSPPSQPDIYIAGSLDDPTLRMGGKNGTDIKGPLTVDGQPVTGGGGDWATITNKPAAFPPSSHTHAIADVSALQAALDAKAPQANVDARLTALTGANTRTSPPLLIFRRNAALKLTSGYLGNIPWDATDEDATLYAADSGRMYAPVAGVYAFSAFITIADPTKTGNRQVVVKKNGTNYTGVAGPSNSANYAGSFSTPIRMAAGDYLEVVAYQNSGANATIIASNAGNSYNNASMQWLRP